MTMKKFLPISFIAVGIFVFSSMFFTACQPDACVTRATECKNGGTCRDGDCVCALGYEGDSCQFTVNEKFEGYYACAKASKLNDNPQTEDDDTLRLKMVPGNRFGLTMYSVRDSIYERIYCTVSGKYITIPQQDIQFVGDYYRYTGSGSLNDGWLTIDLKKEFLDPGGSLVWIEKRTYVGQYYDQ